MCMSFTVWNDRLRAQPDCKMEEKEKGSKRGRGKGRIVVGKRAGRKAEWKLKMGK